MRCVLILFGFAVVLCAPSSAFGQKSSLGAQHRVEVAKNPLPTAPRELRLRKRNLVYERYGWTAAPAAPPRTFKPGDLVTVIVREQRKFEADSDLETKRKFDIKSEVEAFLRPIDRGLGAATFRRGKPNIDYAFDTKLKTEGDTNREDRMTFRLTGKIIDVKPNGQLVIEGRGRVVHDEEVSDVTITGICRKEDVTPDNTVLSTQMADKVVKVDNQGALRVASTRGWVTKFFDMLAPF